MHLIYLDHAATTPLDPRVLESMMPYLSDNFGNPGSIHECGRRAKNAVDNARNQVARFFHCEPEQVIFTSGGSEGNNMVIQGLEQELRRKKRTGITVSAIEHDSVLKAAKKMCIKRDFHLKICPPADDGFIYSMAISDHTTDRTGLVSVMAVNNETGVCNPVDNIGDLCRQYGYLYHCDAVQAAGILDLDTKDGNFSKVDFVTISGHKINGPKGTGAVFARDPKLLSSLICGGAEQEFGFRGGTENVPGIVGLGAACEITQDDLQKHLEYMQVQHSQLVFMLKSLAQQKNVDMRINGDIELISPKTLNVCFPGVDAQTLLLMLDANGICLSAGSACTAHENEPSHVLTAMGISDEDARSSIRISISHLNTADELDRAAQEIISCASMLRGQIDG